MGRGRFPPGLCLFSGAGVASSLPSVLCCSSLIQRSLARGYRLCGIPARPCVALPSRVVACATAVIRRPFRRVHAHMACPPCGAWLAPTTHRPVPQGYVRASCYWGCHGWDSIPGRGTDRGGSPAAASSWWRDCGDDFEVEVSRGSLPRPTVSHPFHPSILPDPMLTQSILVGLNERMRTSLPNGARETSRETDQDLNLEVRISLLGMQIPRS